MLTKDQIIELIKDAICEVTKLDKANVMWNLEGLLFDTYSIDSILLIDLLLTLEQKANVKFNPEELNPEDLVNIVSLCNYVFKQQ
ncbi:phosphopantetheine-binding protein [Cytobacillus oceanisediminis]|uniref:phosphopantetheine-binding protein n=1 Tax=Cytobacillus oceanisediminis TaxID=665099 RepID=UPI001C23CA80|nr:phosphopantetheine-binding protein [Cytobacillus oceanisediminis]MBU8772059.1 hypothetical protein [Cytobacillus oceanisediminis]